MNKAGITASTALALAALAPMGAHAKGVSHFNGNGAFANAYDYGPDGNGLNLYVSQGGTPQSAQTYMDFNSSFCDTLQRTVCEGVSGAGLIPNKSFSATAKGATLSVNLSGLQGFNAVRWRYDLGTGEYSETPFDPGTISLAWKASGLFSQKFIGTTTTTYLNATVKSQGQSTGADALANGSVLGQEWNGVTGTIGTNSNNDRYMERK
jgi:hypothetical protein